MKTIGLLGGMSWESTLEYYRAINQGIKNALGGLHSAKSSCTGVDLAWLKNDAGGDWNGTAALLSDSARRIESAGADFLVICTNTMHIVAPQIESAIQIPLLHIADATAEVLVKDNIKTVGLLGTAFTMEQPFYRHRLMDVYGLEVRVPNAEDRQTVHQIIFRNCVWATLCRIQGRLICASSMIWRPGEHRPSF